MVDMQGTEYVSDATEQELRQLLVKRAEITREAVDLSNANLCRRYGVTPQYLRKLSRQIIERADPVDLYRKLQIALHEHRQDYALFRGDDGIVRVRPMDTSLVRMDGFIGCVNGDTTVVDIQAMVES